MHVTNDEIKRDRTGEVATGGDAATKQIRAKFSTLYEGMLSAERGLAQLSEQFSVLRIELAELLFSCGGLQMDANAEKNIVADDAVRAGRLKRLTSRELAVLRGIAQGRKNRELADAWGVSVRTIEAHRAGMLEKLQVRHVIELGPYISQLEGVADLKG